MAKVIVDRVLETSTTTGSGAYTLSGAVMGFRPASTVCANGDTFDYYAEDVDGNGVPSGGWETGLGTWGTGAILTRTLIYASINAGSPVSWSAGTRRVGLGLTATQIALVPGPNVFENDLLATSSYVIGQTAMVSGATISIATPAVITLANTFIANQPVRFTTTGALPTGLTADGAYYVMATGLTTTTFQVSATSGGTAVSTSGTQSGIHSAGKIKNAITGGPFVIADGLTWGIPTGATWSII